MAAEAPGRRVFVPPPEGRPDITQPFPGFGKPDERRRVERDNISHKCSFIVIDMIRYHIGDANPEYRDSSQRTWEKHYLDLKKRLALIDEEYPDTKSGVNERGRKGRDFMKTVTHETIKSLPIQSTLSLQTASFQKIVAQFEAQKEFKDLYSYVHSYNRKKQREVYMGFFASAARIVPHSPKGASEENFRIALDNWSFYLIATNLGLTPTSWTCKSPFDDLLNILEEKGPLCVGGRFGIPVHKDPPRKVGQSQTTVIFGWPPQKEKVQEELDGFHAVLIIGAERVKKQELVYFRDPCDESITLVMSYRKLCTDYCYIIDTPIDGSRLTYFGYHGPYHSPKQQEAVKIHASKDKVEERKD